MSTTAPTILIVDDESHNRKLLEALLRPEGYLTLTAASGEQALALIAQHPPDLVLLDIMMPGMDGYEVARTLKAAPATANIPIIILTAHDDRSSRMAALTAGAEDFLSKPVDRAELWLRVRNMLRLKALGDLQRDHNLILEQQVQARTAELQRFRSAMDATADAIFLIRRADLRFVEVNATACAMLGYAQEEFLRMDAVVVGMTAVEQLEREFDAIIAGDRPNDLKQTQVRRKDGSMLDVEVHRHAYRTGEAWTIVAVMRDITERQEAEKRLRYLAHFDMLTGLPNRTLFYETLKNTLCQAVDSGWLVAVMFIDLDHFKNVDDTLGHGIGDQLLREVGARLAQCVRIRDTVGRLGGDEFGLVLVMPEGQQAAAAVARKIQDALRAPFDLGGHKVTVSASIGITACPGDADDADTLLKYADTAMYRAKQAGRDNFRFFTAQMNIDVLARQELETALHAAVENGEFVVFYQPKMHVESGRIVGLEALLRWQRPGHGLVSPQDFVPVLEETGLIMVVGRWVIATACEQIGRWTHNGIGPIQVAVNVSGRQFLEGDLAADVTRALDQNAVEADLLELELTESSLMTNTSLTMDCRTGLKRLGVHISIDDFGTGFSSLAYLRRFPIDKLKIDISFIRDITSNPDDATIALAIIRLAHSLKMEVIAEGVETAAQLAYLRRHFCDQVQGYYFSRPLPVAELEQLMLGEKGGGRPRPVRPGQTHRPAMAGRWAGSPPRVIACRIGKQWTGMDAGLPTAAIAIWPPCRHRAVVSMPWPYFLVSRP